MTTHILYVVAQLLIPLLRNLACINYDSLCITVHIDACLSSFIVANFSALQVVHVCHFFPGMLPVYESTPSLV
jgi:hypothetical protein